MEGWPRFLKQAKAGGFDGAISIEHEDYTTLIVRNAKSTNGQANGMQRERDIAPMAAKAIALW